MAFVPSCRVRSAGAVSVHNCAGGPRFSLLAGHPPLTQAAPTGSSLIWPIALKILARMKDAGFSLICWYIIALVFQDQV
jgi:hypothetical protein